MLYCCSSSIDAKTWQGSNVTHPTQGTPPSPSRQCPCMIRRGRGFPPDASLHCPALPCPRFHFIPSVQHACVDASGRRHVPRARRAYKVTREARAAQHAPAPLPVCRRHNIIVVACSPHSLFQWSVARASSSFPGRGSTARAEDE